MQLKLSPRTVELVLRRLLTPHQFDRLLAHARAQGNPDLFSAANDLTLVTAGQYLAAEAESLRTGEDVVTVLQSNGALTWSQSWDAHYFDQQEMLARMVPVESWATTKEVLLTAPLFTDEQFEYMLERVGWRRAVNLIRRPVCRFYGRIRWYARYAMQQTRKTWRRYYWSFYYSDFVSSLRNWLMKARQ